MISLCDGWEFTEQWSEDFLNGKGEAASVRLPHTCKELPLHYIDSESYQMICGYRRTLDVPESAKGKHIFLQFDGAAHIATVYVNGKEAATHRCGYTAFRVEIADLVNFGKPNEITVKLDTTENPDVPPFGFVIDYLTYGGLYREVWLDIREECYVDDIFVYTPALDSAEIQVQVAGETEGKNILLSIIDSEGEIVWCDEAPAGNAKFSAFVPDAHPWTQTDPNMYTCAVAVVDSKDETLDWQEAKFGFRTAEFKADGFYLNGEKTFMRGLNRHQSYPYVGYAVPESLQREDARIVKEELGCNAVRTSHYPQSQYFIDECDKLGLLVFTEFPGWQHIGDAAWKDQAVENAKEMVLQYRNHPSIVLWGVRINESLDDDEFYARTNAVAHELDPSRATSGVRYLENSSLLEDVYAYNDFSHNGKTPGAKHKKDVTPDMGKALLISEHNGHMYPTKSFDDWGHRQEQALRHTRVLNAALSSGEHAGCFGWCMFDYPTHKDFGSGDRICYHGVMDAFRNPKLAAALYASQGDEQTVLEISSSMDIGDYPGGQIGLVYAFTNAEEVELYKNGEFVAKLDPTKWDSLKHPPLLVDDTIGALLETQEGFDPEKAKLLRECLLAAKNYTLAGLPTKYKLLFAYCMKRYGVTFDDATALYSKYVANWGGESTQWRFDAKVGGEVVKSVTCCPSAHLHLEVKSSRTELIENDTYDMAAVRVRILDENGNPAPYAQLPVKLEVKGDIELVGPTDVTAEGGMCGTYICSAGKAGKGTLKISTDQTEPIEVAFKIKVEGE